MGSLVDLPDYIEDEDHRGFLRLYLTLLSEGYSLSIPTQMKLEEIQKGWESILPKFSLKFSTEFVTQLSQYWDYLVKKQGGNLNPTFIDTLLDLVESEVEEVDDEPESDTDSDPVPEVVKPDKKNATLIDGLPKTAKIDLDRQPIQDKITPSISPTYYDYEEAKEEADLIPKTELLPLLKASVEKDNPHGFLVHYLSYCRHSNKPNLPLSTVIDIIHDKWNKIILTDLNLMPEDDFLHTLSTLWYKLVNQKGLPTTKSALEDILFTFMAQNPQSNEPKVRPTSNKKKPFWKLFGKD